MKKVIVFFFLILAREAFAQGCSDAGFCSISNLNQQHTAPVGKAQRLTFLSPLGLGDDGVFVITPGIQYDVHFSRRWDLQAKVTTGYASGNLGNVIGLGDLVVSGVYNIPAKKGWTTSVALGLKAPLNNSDLKGLPLQYQSSLGTFDLIAGFSAANKYWQFATGWQQPLTGANGNTSSSYKEFKRKGDVLLRTAYLFLPERSFKFNLGLLCIYHLGEDTFQKGIAIKGSDGLTLNLTAGGWWQINKRITIGITGGTPVIARDVRPDGLTRKFVLAPELSYNF